MEMDVFKTILDRYVIPYKNYLSQAYRDRANECPPTVIYHKDGEPLLNRRLSDFIRAVVDADSSLKNDIYTNGLLLPKRDGFIEFIGSLPARFRMLVSFHFLNADGDPENDYTETNAYLRRYLTGGRTWPANVELIFASHLIKPMTRERLEEWRESWRPFIDQGRVTVHANVSINPWTGRIEDESCVKFNGCPYGDFGHMFFGATGNVIACCLDLEEEIIFGNVMKDDPAEMVAKLEEFYADQRAKVVKHAVCNNCHGLPHRTRDELLQIGVKA